MTDKEMIIDFLKSIDNILLAFVGVLGILGFHFLYNQSRMLPFVIMLVFFIIHWVNWLVHVKGFKDFDLLKARENADEIIDEFAEYKARDAAYRGFYVAVCMLIMMWLGIGLFPDFMVRLLSVHDNYHKIVPHDCYAKIPYLDGLKLCMEIFIAAQYISSIYQNMKYR